MSFDLNQNLDPFGYEWNMEYEQWNDVASPVENVLEHNSGQQASSADNVEAQNSCPVEDGVLIDDENGDDSLCLSIEKRLAPGAKVDSLEQAYILYCEYGKLMGFSVRKGSQKYQGQSTTIRKKDFLCSCHGLSRPKPTNRLANFKKQDFRTSCDAKLRLLRSAEGIWTVALFNKEHNHELCDPRNSYVLRSARTFSMGKKYLLEALNSAGIRINEACRFMEQEAGGVENTGFIRRDAYNHMHNLKRKSKVDDGDSDLLIKHFIELSNKEHDFYWNIQTDEEGRLLNLFFRDSRCAVDYEFFGDVLSIDTTYKTNRYDMICAPFVGVNHHLKNCLFGLAFISDETTATFEWLFSTFLESMQGKEPVVVFSDQCQAMMNAIDTQFKTCTHRLCQWHINQNAPSHFGSLNGSKDFKTLWFACMNGCESVEEFESTWTRMIDEYNLADDRWFRTMYKLRARWASVFTKEKFCAGLHATSRSEVTNKVMKDISSSSSTLYELVVKCKQIQLDWRRREGEDDTASLGIPGLLVSNNPLLKQLSKYLTRKVFLSYEYEATHSLNVDILHEQAIDERGHLVEYSIKDCQDPLRVRRVTYDSLTSEANCSCFLWQNVGVLCSHVFKIYFHRNIKVIPSMYMMRRLSREAKKRRASDVLGEGEQASTENNGFEDAAFKSHVMRTTYEILYDMKFDLKMKAHVLERFETLHEELRSMSKEDDNHGRRDPIYNFKNSVEKPACRDPVLPKNRRFTTTRLSRHWEKPRRKKKKMTYEAQGSSVLIPLRRTNTASPSLNESPFPRTSPATSDPNIGRGNDFMPFSTRFGHLVMTQQHSVLHSSAPSDLVNYCMPPTPSSPLTPISQDDTFYKWPWSRDRETLVLLKFVDAYHEGSWVKGEVESNAMTVEHVHSSLSYNSPYLNIPKISYYHKLDEWYWRFFNFTTMLECFDDIWYDEERNLVYASTTTWTRLSQVRPSFLCYCPEGEMNYKLLKLLFETEDGSDDAEAG